MVRLCAILMMSAALFARADTAAERLAADGVVEFSAAYRTWDGARFAAASDLFRRAATNASATATNFYWLGVAEFHRMLQLQNPAGTATNRDSADRALESAIDALTTAVKLDGRAAECHALLGTLYGMKIDGHLLRAARFGPRVARHQAKALEFGAANPRVQYLLGMCQFHTASKPAEWRQSLATLLAAEKLFEAAVTNAPAPLEPRWGHDSCLTFIGRAHEMLGQRTEARDYFCKALAIHPGDNVASAGLKRTTGSE
jgi:tetratricopeptide (TPR) repeat protein